ncbi:MAG: hypothetical protein GY797_40830 [Deltaproteobacteria bacterium]|nr:hypothetical protein [Deltaproteobacteria bacterium]
MSTSEKAKMRFELLKAEVDILSSNINGTIDRLWKIRALCITLWSATIAIGLGATTRNRAPILPLLWVSIFLPLLFWWIDATYNSWYCRLMIREREISKFINTQNYRLPSSNKVLSFDSFLTGSAIDFPVYDQGAHETFGKNSWFKWKVSKFHSFSDKRPIIIFGGQTVISSVLIILQQEDMSLWFSAIPTAFLVIVVVLNFIVNTRVERANKSINSDRK